MNNKRESSNKSFSLSCCWQRQQQCVCVNKIYTNTFACLIWVSHFVCDYAASAQPLLSWFISEHWHLIAFLFWWNLSWVLLQASDRKHQPLFLGYSYPLKCNLGIWDLSWNFQSSQDVKILNIFKSQQKDKIDFSSKRHCIYFWHYVPVAAFCTDFCYDVFCYDASWKYLELSSQAYKEEKE